MRNPLDLNGKYQVWRVPIPTLHPYLYIYLYLYTHIWICHKFLLEKSFIRIFQIIKIVVTALCMDIVLLVVTTNNIITKKTDITTIIWDILTTIVTLKYSLPYLNCYSFIIKCQKDVKLGWIVKSAGPTWYL